jgi:hypothetical protein
VGNSNVKLQHVVDEVSVIGDLAPVLKNTGGYADQPALTIASTVMREMISTRFPWKWNRVKIPPFVLTPLQQDYASINIFNIGWLESGVRIDINNSQVPPPSWPITAVRDLAMDNTQGGFPGQFCWFPNDQLEYNPWPGPGVTYANPVSPQAQNNNYYTNIMDEYGNILILTQYGTTGLTPPTPPPPPIPAPPNYPAGVVIQDGTCTWTCANPKAQGFRFFPRPPSGGNVWLCRLFAQLKAPPAFQNLGEYIDPIPDDYSNWFTDGFIAYAHRYASNPSVLARFPQQRQLWLEGLAGAAKQGDREDEAKGFFPDKPIMAPSYIQDQGPFPYRYGWGGWT